MNCEHANEQFSELLSNQLPDAERLELEAHIAGCPRCQQETDAMKQLWQQLARVSAPEPSDRMRVRFDAMLDTYKDTITREQPSTLNTVVTKLRAFLTPQVALRVAYSLALVGIGIGVGNWLNPKPATTAYQQQIDSLSSQVQDMRQMMLLSLLDNPSASERLRAVSYTDELSQTNGRVIEALLTTLNNDPNVNVRLVTLEALAKLADDATVRRGLVQSLTQQDSPLVQVALADVMVKLQEKRSLKPLRQLLQQEHLNDLVKSKIQASIKALS